ncbi:Uncharacterized protein QTN25_007833 [Entamoeba marina]
MKHVTLSSLRTIQKSIALSFAPRISFLISDNLAQNLEHPLWRILTSAYPASIIGDVKNPVILTAPFPNIQVIQRTSLLPSTHALRLQSDWFSLYRFGSSVDVSNDPVDNMGIPIGIVLACTDNDCNGDTISALSGLSTDTETLKRIRGENAEKIYLCVTENKNIKFRSQWKYKAELDVHNKESVDAFRSLLARVTYEILDSEIEKLEEIKANRVGIRGVFRGLFTNTSQLQEEMHESSTFRNIHRRLGDLHFSKRNYEKAIENYQAAIEGYSDNPRQLAGCYEMLGYAMFMLGGAFRIPLDNAFSYFTNLAKTSQTAADSDYLMARRIGLNYFAMMSGDEWEKHMYKLLQLPKHSPLFCGLIYEQLAIYYITSNLPRKSASAFMFASNFYFEASEKLGGLRCVCHSRCVYHSKKDLLLPTLLTASCLADELKTKQILTESLAFLLHACDQRLIDNHSLSLHPPLTACISENIPPVIVNEPMEISVRINNNHNFTFNLSSIRLQIEGGEVSNEETINGTQWIDMNLKGIFKTVGKRVIHGLDVQIYGLTSFIPFTKPLIFEVVEHKLPVSITIQTKTDVWAGEIVDTEVILENISDEELESISVGTSPDFCVCNGTKEGNMKWFTCETLQKGEHSNIHIQHRVTKESQQMTIQINNGNEMIWKELYHYEITPLLTIQSQLLGRVNTPSNILVKLIIKAYEEFQLPCIVLLSKSWSSPQLLTSSKASVFQNGSTSSFLLQMNSTIESSLQPTTIEFTESIPDSYYNLALQFITHAHQYLKEEVIDNIIVVPWKSSTRIGVDFVDFIPVTLRRGATYPFTFVHNPLLPVTKTAQIQRHQTSLTELHSLFVGHVVQFPTTVQTELTTPITVTIEFLNTTKLPIRIKILCDSPLNPISHIHQLQDIPILSLWYGNLGTSLLLNSFQITSTQFQCLFLCYGEQTLPQAYWCYSFDDVIWSDLIALNTHTHAVTFLPPDESDFENELVE